MRKNRKNDDELCGSCGVALSAHDPLGRRFDPLFRNIVVCDGYVYSTDGRETAQDRINATARVEREVDEAEDDRLVERFTERPADRAERIASMTVDPDRVATMRRALGME